MWPWRLNWLVAKTNQFWFQLIILSLVGHLVVLGLILARGYNEKLTLTISSRPQSIDVILLPLYKRIVPKPAVGGVSTKASKVRVQTKPKPTPVAKPKPKIKSIPAKPQAKKPLKLQSQSVKIKPEVKPKPNPSMQTTSKVLPEPVPVEPAAVGRKDWQDLQLSQKIEAAIAELWQPPVGFDSEVSCTVELKIDQNGRVEQFNIIKSAGILVYDLSVRQAISQIKFPSEVCNQTINVVFKP